MSTWSDSICENTFETSHVRFIHENFSVLITIPLDQIQQNLLRKETCQTTAKPADIVLQTWFEEYPTPPYAGSRINFRTTFPDSHFFKWVQDRHISRFCSVFQVIQVISSARFFFAEEVDSTHESKSINLLQLMNLNPCIWFQRFLFGKQTVKKFFYQMI